MTIDVELRVRYAETDQMGVAYYGSHFIWFEVARTEYCRACGFRYAEMEKETGLYMVVVEATCRYRAPARYDDALVVRTAVSDLRRRLIRFRYTVFDKSSGRRVAEGETVHLLADRAGKTHPFPEAYFDILRRTHSV